MAVKNPLLAQYKDPASRALINQAEQAGDLASKKSMEMNNARGLLNSSIAVRDVADAQNQAVTNIMPQLQQMAEQRRQQALENQFRQRQMSMQERQFNADQGYRNQQLAMERQRMEQTNRSDNTKWQYEANMNNQAMDMIKNRIGAFRTPGDFDAELQRDVSGGKIDPQLYSLIKEYLMKNYDSSDYVLPTWGQKQKTPSINQIFQRAY